MNSDDSDVRPFACPGLETDFSADPFFQALNEKELTADALFSLAAYVRARRRSAFVFYPPAIALNVLPLGVPVIRDAGGWRADPSFQWDADAFLRETRTPAEVRADSARDGFLFRAAEAGIPAVVSVTGAFTLGLTLLGSRKIFRLIRKDPDYLLRILEKLTAYSVRQTRECAANGAGLFYYSDPAASVQTLGSDHYRVFALSMTESYLREIRPLLDTSAVLLCPGTLREMRRIKKGGGMPGLSIGDNSALPDPAASPLRGIRSGPCLMCDRLFR